ncbi:MAG: hypothetical protein JWO89_725 [Verrucomicrobiaceae bacterium]|nr:hypothetical protein [Verrucomicrobiaceae bacterium]
MRLHFDVPFHTFMNLGRSFVATLIFLSSAVIAPAITTLTYSNFDAPLASTGGITILRGIGDGVIVGNYIAANHNTHSFVYDQGTFSYPASAAFLIDASGGAVLGSSWGDAPGFIYQNGTFTPLSFDIDGIIVHDAQGMDGNSFIGVYQKPLLAPLHGFLSVDGVITKIDDPLAASFGGGRNGTFGPSTVPEDIDGTNVVGSFTTAAGYRGFLFDGTQYTTIDDPLGVKGTWATGISGDYVVGYYHTADSRTHGFLFDGSDYLTMDFVTQDHPLPPLATVPLGIDGNMIVGYYVDAETYVIHGFTAVVPEPGSALMVCLAGLALLKRRRGVAWKA